MRTTLELLEKLSTELDNTICAGVCEVINELRITDGETNKLYGYFKNNKPDYTNHNEFYEHETFGGSPFWWTLNREGMEQRRLFIKHLIEQVKKDESLLP